MTRFSFTIYIIIYVNSRVPSSGFKVGPGGAAYHVYIYIYMCNIYMYVHFRTVSIILTPMFSRIFTFVLKHRDHNMGEISKFLMFNPQYWTKPQYLMVEAIETPMKTRIPSLFMEPSLMVDPGVVCRSLCLQEGMNITSFSV